MLRLFTAVWLCLLIVSVGGCSRPSSKVVGKWQGIVADDPSAYEFFKDGSAMLREGRTTLNGTWKFLDDGRLKVEATVMGTAVTEVYDVTFDRDTATFKDSQGKAQKFNKVKEFVSSAEQQMQKAKQMQDALFAGGPPKREDFDKLRMEVDKLSPEQRRELMEHGMQRGMERLQKRIDEYFAAPPDERNKVLDKQIADDEKHRKEREKRRQENGGRSDPPDGQPTGGGYGEPDGNPNAKPQQHNEMLGHSTPEQRSRAAAYFAALKQRRIQLGLPATSSLPRN